MKLEEYRRKREQDPEYIAARKSLRWHFFVEDIKLAFSMWWRSSCEFGGAFFGWLRWCKHGLPRQQLCTYCEKKMWTFGHRLALTCSTECFNGRAERLAACFGKES